MDRESLDRLRFDRRLQNRRGWLAPGELERHVETLPDVAEKLTKLAGEESAAGAEASTAQPASGTGPS
ncbi:MAG: hypothetical protein IPK00_21445 [Deltaproteobacteria bacterium]|nr:hypothetical protein [Deltaproteobacteria bacterium]